LKCLSRALDTRGFTLSAYVKCLDYYESVLPYRHCNGLQKELNISVPYIRTRWLRPGNCADLASLINRGQLDLLRIYSSTGNIASVYDAVSLFQDPAVDLSWLLTLMDYCETNMFIHSAVWAKFLCTAFERLDITGEQLDQLYTRAEKYIMQPSWSIISAAAYSSQNKEVLEWAINHGLGPSSQLLREMLDH
jgi:hypothetical protein